MVLSEVGSALRRSRGALRRSAAFCGALRRSAFRCYVVFRRIPLHSVMYSVLLCQENHVYSVVFRCVPFCFVRNKLCVCVPLSVAIRCYPLFRYPGRQGQEEGWQRQAGRGNQAGRQAGRQRQAGRGWQKQAGKQRQAGRQRQAEPGAGRARQGHKGPRAQEQAGAQGEMQGGAGAQGIAVAWHAHQRSWAQRVD